MHISSSCLRSHLQTKFPSAEAGGKSNPKRANWERQEIAGNGTNKKEEAEDVAK
jgi:hypothetical protein